jgi:hypothetical protein
MSELLPIGGSNQPEIPRAPAGLRAAGRRLWRDLQGAYDFSECPERVILLEQACRTADLVARLQKVVDEADDLRTRGSQGQQVAIPEVAELRQHRAQLAALVKSLALPDEDEGQPLTKSQLGRMAANARWGRRYG